MAKTYNILGVSLFEIGAHNSGNMGLALTSYGDIEKNSVSIEGQTAEENTIETEDNDAYITLNASVTPTKLKARLYGVPYSDYPTLMGGATVGEKWSEPALKPNIFLSVRLTGQDVDGFKSVVEIPYAKVNARLSGSIGKDQLPAIDIEMTVNSPTSDDQFTIERVAV